MQQNDPIPPEQTWFWSENWQEMEREAQADIDAGRVRLYKNIDEALDDLEASIHTSNTDEQRNKRIV